ncbi:MAG TPA: sigma-54-dependent Fis family transcriptional regulator [Gemmatimonadales bacterium]|nr:sigma-54-dependent Fis family transcriptional regulator [Gemmatimonadales bacterium]
MERSDIAPLEAVLCTEELARRPSRPPDHAKENRALVALADALTHSPETILQTLADTILDVLDAGSAGLSLLTTINGEERFYWAAIAGLWKPHLGGGTPRHFGPCGDVLDRSTPLLYRHPEQRYEYLGAATPVAVECLLVPFYLGGRAVGTIWAMAHDALRRFDSEDERLLIVLGRFASSAYAVATQLGNAPIAPPAAPRRRASAPAPARDEIIGSSPAIKLVLKNIQRVAPMETTVLITGETGTGKGLIARAIHQRSARAAGPFVGVNCGAIPQTLIASELFGHEKGAFTGAGGRRIGRFELAAGGTLFLDEVADLPNESQTALLRVLQEHEFERVGGNDAIRSNVRVVAASNRSLHEAVEAGTFRKDLLYRLNVFPIEVPPLRRRRTDIPLLIDYFVRGFADRSGKPIPRLSPETRELLQEYDWPGNVRELQNLIERAMILSDGRALDVDPRWLSDASSESVPARRPTKPLVAQEQRMIEVALAESRGRVAGPFGAAARLGIPPSTLESKIKALRIQKARFKLSPAD